MDVASLIAGFMAWSQGLILNFGYLGVFIVSLVSSASIIFPVPGFLFILAASPFLNPWLLGIVAGAGSAVGELTGYIIGKGSHKTLKKLNKWEKKWLKRGEEWFTEGRGFLFIFIFAATPLPDDVTGIVAGLFNYDWKKFLLASFLGKLVMNLMLAFAGLYSIGWLMNVFGLNM